MFVAASGLVLLGGAAVQSAPATPAPVAAPPVAAVPTEVPGEATTKRLCSQCHTLESATVNRHTRDEWNDVIVRMMNQGLVATDDELYEVSDYLTANYGPAPKE